MVNSRCCVPGCRNIFKKSSLLGFMRFPPEGELKNKWLNAIGRKASEITEESIMCCEHFSLSSYVVPGKVLRYNAVPTIFRNSNPLRKMPSEEKNQNCSSQGNVSRERLRPRILRSKPPQKIRSGEIKENSASQEDVAMERLRPHSPPLEVTILISEDEEMDEPETSEETDSRDLLYYPVMELEDEEEQEHSEASLELDSQRTHYQRLLQQVISAPDSLSNRPTFYRSRNNACIQVQMDRENPQLGMKKMRKRIKALNKRKRGLDKLLKNIYEVSALHEYKRLVEADYKQILGEPLEEISSADEPECQLEEHSYSQKTKQADPNSERQNETTAESTIPISVNDSTTPVNDSTTPVNDSTTPVNDSTTPVNAPQVPEKQAKDIIVQVMQRSTTQNESNHSES